MRYTTILFDSDETLLDFKKSEREAITGALAFAGVNADSEMIAEYSRINRSLWNLLEKGEIKKEELKYRRFEIFFDKYGVSGAPKATANKYMELLSKRGYLLDGADTLCESLSKKADLYMVTNGIKFIQEGRLADSGIICYFKDIFISEDAGFDKPRVEFFEYVSARIPDFSKENTLIVGDSLTSDMAGGINFGIDTCWYNPKRVEAPSDISGKITYTVSSYEEIYDLVTKGE
ncbi:MAG: noncanonical pyrimidine nucleotidase, YjjG family [Ruminococcaceae bacterium]|nr:noncanonical pyrimidine nucleotidase, YjjG family [Oscillospiraceae bacterium]